MSADEKKERKKAQVKKNRKTQELFWAFKRMREHSDLIREQGEDARESGPEGKTTEMVVMGEKTQAIRNKLTGRKRAAKERWNRFSGTGGAGARGL